MIDWLVLAFASSVFAALTSIFAKIGIRDIDSDYATAVRTIVVMVMSVIVVLVSGSYASLGDVTACSLAFLVLSGLATGGSWLCYFKAIQMGDVNKVVPIDKSSVVLTANVLLPRRLPSRCQPSRRPLSMQSTRNSSDRARNLKPTTASKKRHKWK